MNSTMEITTASTGPSVGTGYVAISRSESRDTASGGSVPARMELTGVLADGIEEAGSEDDRKLAAEESNEESDEEMEDESEYSAEEEDGDDDGEEGDNGPFLPPGGGPPVLAPLPVHGLPPHMQARNLAHPPQRPGVAGYGRLTSPSGSVIAMPNVPSPVGETLSSQTDANLLEAGDSVRNMTLAQQHAVLARCNDHINRLDGRASAQFQAMAPGDAATQQWRVEQMMTALRRAVSAADTPKWLTEPPSFSGAYGLYTYDMYFARVNTATHTHDKKALAHGRLYETESAANYWSACFIRAYVEHGMDVPTSRSIANAQLRNLIAKKYGLVGGSVNHTFPN